MNLCNMALIVPHKIGSYPCKTVFLIVLPPLLLLYYFSPTITTASAATNNVTIATISL